MKPIKINKKIKVKQRKKVRKKYGKIEGRNREEMKKKRVK